MGGRLRKGLSSARDGDRGQPGTGDELACGLRGFEARSRDLRPEELEAFVRVAKHEPTAVPVSLDALAIYLHAKNPI